MYKIFLILLAFLLNSNSILFSQKNNYQIKYYNLIIDDEHKHYTDNESSLNIYSFYKKYISSQDHSSCPYHPSCSTYAFTSIKKDGIIKGLIKGFDRLLRCNRNQEHQYTLNKNHKMIDFP